jgi:hypothetical protein
VNITAGSPYYKPHIQRPALYPPSDGYRPPEDPLVGVALQMKVTQQLKRLFPNLIIVGTAYSYLQDFLPNVAQAAVREGWTDLAGLGRMVLTYPEILWDATEGNKIQHKRVCRTFSDCTTAPRKGLPSGCYPLDSYYKISELAERLKVAKAKRLKSNPSFNGKYSAARCKASRRHLPYEADGRMPPKFSKSSARHASRRIDERRIWTPAT